MKVRPLRCASQAVAIMVIKKHVFGPFDTNGFLVAEKHSGRCLVIDPGPGSEDMLRTILQHNWQVDWILNTHGHWDHIYCNSLFVRETGGTLAIHEGDLDLLQALGDQCFWMGFEPGESSPPPGHLLHEGEVLTIGGISCTVLHIPGHSPGGVAFYFAQEGVAFVGDSLFAGSVGRSDLPGGNHEQLIESIRSKLLTLPDETIVYCGHGPETTIGRERISNPFLA